jgi:hypothetical protein
MKHAFSLLAVLFMATIFFPGAASSSKNSESTSLTPKKVEVYYFHFTRRCMTCNNVEKVSKEAVEKQYAEKVKAGEISFRSINLDEKDGEAVGAKLKVEGQTLLIVSGDKRVDLTDKGFMYANDSPEKLKAEIKKAIDDMLK